jgi:hypothetical protein
MNYAYGVEFVEADPITMGARQGLPARPTRVSLFGGRSIFQCAFVLLSEFRQALRELVNRGFRRIVLNMADVTYVDSADIGELAQCRMREPLKSK